MTPEEQRIALAEWAGWKEIEIVSGLKDVKGIPAEASSEATIWPDHTHAWLPDYLNDLNAVHELEERLTEPQKKEYARLLAENCGWRDGGLVGWSCGVSPYGFFGLVHLTPAQRCEALLRTIGRWEETKE